MAISYVDTYQSTRELSIEHQKKMKYAYYDMTPRVYKEASPTDHYKLS